MSLSFYRYSGEYRDFGVYIDDLATFVWENVSRNQTKYTVYVVLFIAVSSSSSRISLGVDGGGVGMGERRDGGEKGWVGEGMGGRRDG